MRKGHSNARRGRALVHVASVLGLLMGLDQPVDAQGPTAAPADDSGYVEVEGARLYYELYGDPSSSDAVPLLILHGGFMSGGAMADFAHAFRADRPVILLDQRAHGRSTGLDGPVTYPQMGDDAAAAVAALGLERADVLGYSMGAGAALQMAIRHPDRVGKLVVLSGTYRRDGWCPEVIEAIGSLPAELIEGSPLGTEYRRLSPTPDRFREYFERVKVLNHQEQDIPDEQIRAITAPTMVIIGDADGVRPEHAVRLFELRGGGDRQAAAMGVLTEAPRARLLVLPATSHLGLMGMVPDIARHVGDFLDDARPRLPAAYGGQD